MGEYINREELKTKIREETTKRRNKPFLTSVSVILKIIRDMESVDIQLVCPHCGTKMQNDDTKEIMNVFEFKKRMKGKTI